MEVVSELIAEGAVTTVESEAMRPFEVVSMAVGPVTTAESVARRLVDVV